MPHKKLFLSLLTLLFLQITVAQKLNAIDQKGTKIEIINNKVTTAATAPSNPNSNDVWFDTSTAPTTVKIYNGTAWLIMEHKGTTGSVFFAATNGLPTEDNSQLFWDNSAKSLKVGATGNIDTKLTVNGKVLSNTALELKGTLIDALSSAGTAGQVLTSTGTGTSWINNANWLSTGNTGTTASNFLGNIDDVKMSIVSDSQSMLEFGRRSTLGLINTGRNDYTDGTQPTVYVRGDGTRAALQFAAAGASFYKPMFFTVANGSFRLKGSAGGTDMFEIGSAGPSNQGRLEFVVGDDGLEPMIFKRFEHTTNVHREFFRVQASADGSTTKTRFGININPDSVPISAATLTYDTGDSGVVANSTLQVNGSISNSTFTTTGALTLTEDHYAIILGGNHQITLPTASGSKGRIYIIKNPTSSSVSLSSSSSYLTNLNIASTIIASGVILWIQSDGTNWQQITGGNESITTISNTVPAASGNLIGNYKNEANVTTGIYETVTSLTQSIGSSATGEITYKDEKGNSSKARVVSANSNNQIEVGTDGGAYLGSTVYTGSFLLTAPTSTTATSITYIGLPFQPSQMTFVAHANVESTDIDLPGSGLNDINNSFGTMNGVARQSSSTTISQQVIYIGGSGQSINNISRFSSSSNCIGLRYGNQDAANLGKITASMTSFNANGFTLNVKYTAAASGNTAVLGENVIVLFTAYK
ncbi:hypothetical protein [Flavobacterium frigidarium]|uniref:hypothetical protein n=1 Tax=Flavobacterium frigidarium TaxID=99286 RepID=UPI00047E1D24|nr:hypothetical protein [Flavobacterium frigidarium]